MSGIQDWLSPEGTDYSKEDKEEFESVKAICSTDATIAGLISDISKHFDNTNTNTSSFAPLHLLLQVLLPSSQLGAGAAAIIRLRQRHL